MSQLTYISWFDILNNISVVPQYILSGQEGYELLKKKDPEKFRGCLEIFSSLSGLASTTIKFSSWMVMRQRTITSKNPQPATQKNSSLLSTLENSLLLVSWLTKLASDCWKIFSERTSAINTPMKILRLSVPSFEFLQILFNYKIISKNWRDNIFSGLLGTDVAVASIETLRFFNCWREAKQKLQETERYYQNHNNLLLQRRAHANINLSPAQKRSLAAFRFIKAAYEHLVELRNCESETLPDGIQPHPRLQQYRCQISGKIPRSPCRPLQNQGPYSYYVKSELKKKLLQNKIKGSKEPPPGWPSNVVFSEENIVSDLKAEQDVEQIIRQEIIPFCQKEISALENFPQSSSYSLSSSSVSSSSAGSTASSPSAAPLPMTEQTSISHPNSSPKKE